MIARMISTPSGPRIRSFGRAGRGRRVLVVVDSRLYAPEAPDRWPIPPDAGALLQARSRGEVLTARREILACCNAAFPRSRVTVLPHAFLPSRRSRFVRNREIRRRRFRRVPDRSRRNGFVAVAGTAAACLLVVLLTTNIVMQSNAVAGSVAELRMERNETDRHVQMLRMREAELLTLMAEADDDRRLAPGRLMDALVQVLTGDERYSRISLVGDRLTLVVDTRDPGVAARVGALPGVRPVSHAVDRRGDEMIATIEAHLE